MVGALICGAALGLSQRGLRHLLDAAPPGPGGVRTGDRDLVDPVRRPLRAGGQAQRVAGRPHGPARPGAGRASAPRPSCAPRTRSSTTCPPWCCSGRRRPWASPRPCPPSSRCSPRGRRPPRSGRIQGMFATSQTACTAGGRRGRRRRLRRRLVAALRHRGRRSCSWRWWWWPSSGGRCPGGSHRPPGRLRRLRIGAGAGSAPIGLRCSARSRSGSAATCSRHSGWPRPGTLLRHSGHSRTGSSLGRQAEAVHQRG